MRATQRKNRRAIALVASSLIIIARADQAESFSLLVQSVLHLKGGGRQESPSQVVLPDDSAGNTLHAEATFSTLEPAYVQPLHSQGQLTLPYRLSLSPAATIPRKQATHQKRLLPSAVKQSKKAVDRFLLAIFATYLCSMFALSIPAVMLVPVIASDPTSHALALSSAPDMAASASFLAKMVGLGTFGGAVGKSVNGFVCQALGGRLTSRLYFLGLATSSLLLSQCRQSFHGAAIFMIEFFSSVSWTACTLMLASAYQNSPERFTKGMAVLSLASTLGALFTKGAGILMLQHFHWRNVCKIAAAIALCGACVVHAFIKEHDLMTESDRLRASIRQRAGLKPAAKPKQVVGIVNSLRDILSSPMFWTVGIAHGMGFLARRSDAFLGSFLAAACDVPGEFHRICIHVDGNFREEEFVDNFHLSYLFLLSYIYSASLWRIHRVRDSWIHFWAQIKQTLLQLNARIRKREVCAKRLQHLSCGCFRACTVCKFCGIDVPWQNTHNSGNYRGIFLHVKRNIISILPTPCQMCDSLCRQQSCLYIISRRSRISHWRADMVLPWLDHLSIWMVGGMGNHRWVFGTWWKGHDKSTARCPRIRVVIQK